MVEKKEELYIWLPNIQYNIYQLFEKTNFFGKTSYLLMVDSRECPVDRKRDDYYSRMESDIFKGKEISLESWNTIKDNISYLNALKWNGIRRDVLQYIRTESFKKTAKLLEFGIMDPSFNWGQDQVVFKYENSKKIAVVSGQGIKILMDGKIEQEYVAPLFKIGVLKYWCLYLWKQYNNYMKTGFNKFRIIYEGREYVGHVCGPFHEWSAPNDYFWAWLDEFNLIYE